MEGRIVLYPIMAIGHIVSMVELGKLILRHYHHRFSVTVIIAEGPIDTPDVTAFLRHISETTHSITFHHLPSLFIKPSPNRPRPLVCTEFIHLNNPNLTHALQTISKISRVRALVIDFFCTPALTVASDLGIPAYYFLTGGAVTLSFLLYLPIIHKQTTKSFRDISTTNLHFPGLPPIPASYLPYPVQDRQSQMYNDVLEIGLNLRRSKGIMVNTFECLESTLIKAITDGLCAPDGPTPPVYCIGPLIASPNNRSGEGDEAVHHCLSWLDAQPSQSVVFLCFGSGGVFSAKQVRDIAIGLEKSGQRFLWVVRQPVSEDNNKHLASEHKDPDLEALLPQGFLDRNKERALVVKSWAPQVEVLNHESVGGFVTHCGWNSVLEAVCAGVPMVAWPLYAEQRMNKVFLVEEMKFAMPMEESENGLVSAAEVEKRVRALMESEEGRVLREQSRKMKEEAMTVWSECGSSMTAFSKLADSWINH
ncbi:UDP-glycosyltransferase 88F3-like [Telopea speciosissima]|uniref:UDP-glycosyltransferase 88F3-like n=1 Tax=Telopea speciosissima TaxID=54955 RepID=UPI001CC8106F|nr:UDP-glycosyltransferase 88F3-like [Telopea speciosissima]